MTTDPIACLNAALEGRYRIEREIGEGGMAVVYLAEDLRHERKVALKVLKPELAAVVGAERFLAEIKTTANLQHPHILPLHDSGEADGFLYFVMPYIEGDTLRDKIDREKQLSIEEALKITEKVASALDYAHEHGVVHRDIKPGNILLSAKGEPTVADFGIALAVAHAGGGRVTETGLSVGTPHYMSPEQATGDRDVDPRTDVYALGCVLYEMLTGDPPYQGSTAQAVLARILTDPAPTPTKVRVSIPPNVDAAIRKALEKLPADRFSSAQDFSRALTDSGFRHGAHVAAEVAAGVGFWKPMAIGLAVVALVYTVGFALLLFQSDPPEPVTRLAVSIPEPQGFAPRGDLDLSADGSLMVYRGVNPGGTPQLFVRQWNALDATPIRDTDGATRPAISPDGLEVAFTPGGAGAVIRIVPLQGGISRTLTEEGRPNGSLPRWSPDGAWIYYSAPGGIRRLPSGGGLDPEIVTQVDSTGGETHTYVDVLPGGDALYTTYSEGQAPSIQAVDLETGDVTAITEGRYPRYSSTGHLLFQDATETTLLVVPFDAESLELRGAPRPIADGLIPVGNSELGQNPGSFAVSGTGRLIYRVGSSVGTTVVPTWVERDGVAREIDPDWSFQSTTNTQSSLRLSPEGARLAISIRDSGVTDLWVKQLDDGPLLRVTFGDGTQNFRATWSADGASLTFLSNRAGSSDVWIQPADGSGTAELVLDRERAILEALRSPDGSWLIFREGVGGGLGDDIFAIRPGVDSVAVSLVAGQFEERYPALSRDGRWLAYVTDASGREEVYVSPFPDAGSSRTLVSAGGGTEPVWAHNGRELFYRSEDNELVAVQFTAGPAFTPGQRTVLFSMNGYEVADGSVLYDVSPDDQEFVMLRINDDAAATQLILVQNFFEELRQMVPDP